MRVLVFLTIVALSAACIIEGLALRRPPASDIERVALRASNGARQEFCGYYVQMLERQRVELSTINDRARLAEASVRLDLLTDAPFFDICGVDRNKELSVQRQAVRECRGAEDYHCVANFAQWVLLATPDPPRTYVHF